MDYEVDEVASEPFIQSFCENTYCMSLNGTNMNANALNTAFPSNGCWQLTVWNLRDFECLSCRIISNMRIFGLLVLLA